MRNGYLTFFGVSVCVALSVGAGCSINPGDPAGAAGTGTAGANNAAGANGVGGSGAMASCTSVSACGGNVVGTWKVASSCLKLSGNMDVSLLSLACPTVPVTGSISTTGTFVAKADGTYTDN